MTRARQAPFDAERVNACYKLSLPAPECRVLEVYAESPPVLHPSAWSGSTLLAAHVDALPTLQGAFDCIVVHRALDELAGRARRQEAPFEPRRLLERLAQLLAIGGTIAGCVENRKRVKHWELALPKRRRPMFSPGECRASLAAAGFRPVRLFSVVPAADSPRKLIGLPEDSPRRASRRHVEALRPLLSRRGYLLWRAFAEIGLVEHLGGAILFLGRRAC